jgi:hypothetical protein
MQTSLAKQNSRLPIEKRTRILLRVPALRTEGKVIFPGIGPLSDGEFLDLVRDTMCRGYRVYLKDLPPGQAAVPIIKADRTASLAVSNEFSKQVQALRTELRRRA